MQHSGQPVVPDDHAMLLEDKDHSADPVAASRPTGALMVTGPRRAAGGPSPFTGLRGPSAYAVVVGALAAGYGARYLLEKTTRTIPDDQKDDLQSRLARIEHKLRRGLPDRRPTVI
jgi:hypothetical protein